GVAADHRPRAVSDGIGRPSAIGPTKGYQQKNRHAKDHGRPMPHTHRRLAFFHAGPGKSSFRIVAETASAREGTMDGTLHGPHTRRSGFTVSAHAMKLLRPVRLPLLKCSASGLFCFPSNATRVGHAMPLSKNEL